MLAEQTLRWVRTCQVNDDRNRGFVLGASASEPTIMSLCFAILAAELYGALPPQEVEDWQRMLLSVQEPATGLFVDPLLSPADLEATSPGEEYLIYQTTYFALNALDALGSRPRHALRFVEAYCEPAVIERWLDGLDWSDAWEQSNWVMFVASGLYGASQWENNRAAFDALHRLLDWLDAHQDPVTGFWGLAEGATLLDAMAGGYHYLPFYFCLGRTVHFPMQMIDSTLSLQQSDGLFHPKGGGDTCLDVDAVDILVKCSMLTPHRSAEVEAALEVAYRGILDSRGLDGGFSRARHRPMPPKSWKRRLSEPLGLDRLLRKPYEPPKEVWNYSGWTMMPFDIREGDLWSTWFRSFGLAVIESRYPTKFPKGQNWQFRTLPALGWHDSQRITQPGAAEPARFTL